MNRIGLALTLLAATLATGCFEDDDPADQQQSPQAPAVPGAPQTPATPQQPGQPAPITPAACQAAAARSIALAPDASHVQIVADRVYYTSAGQLHEVKLDGTSPLVSMSNAAGAQVGYWARAASLIAASGNMSNGSITEYDIDAAGKQVGASRGTGWAVGSGPVPGPDVALDPIAQGLMPFGEATNQIWISDVGEVGTRIIRFSGASNEFQVLSPAPFLSDLAVRSDGTIFAVQEGTTVVSAAKTNGTTAPTKVATYGQGCRLAIDDTNYYCATKTGIFAADKLLAPASTEPTAIAVDKGMVFVAAGGNLRVVSANGETTRACGHGAITSIAVNDKHVVFAEDGKGVFVTDR